jgi:molybdate transport system substrate-binding protein
MSRLVPLAATVLAWTCGLAACAPGAPEEARLRVFASASLAAAFEELGARFEEAHGALSFELHTAGTPRLLLQLAEGAPAEVLATADRESLERVVATGRVHGEPHAFARGHLALVTAPGNPLGIGGLEDLAREDLVVVLCGPEVPAGRYARAALAAEGVLVRSASDEPSVRAALQRVRLGEADAAVVYATDAAAAGESVHAIALADPPGLRVEYPIVALDDSTAASAFVDFVLGPEGRAVLQAHGFETP